MRRILFITLFLAAIGYVTSAKATHKKNDYQGYDSPVDKTAETITAAPERHGIPLAARRPSEMPWAYEEDRRLYDYARVLPPVEAQRVRNLLRGSSFTIATMPYRDGEPLDEYAQRVRNQFDKEIPSGCRKAALVASNDARERRCFIDMPAHDRNRETVLVYDPHARAYAVTYGTRPLPTTLVNEMVTLLKSQPYHAARALAGYEPEAAPIGRISTSMPQRANQPFQAAFSHPPAFAGDPHVLAYVLFIGITIVGGGITCLVIYYRPGLSPSSANALAQRKPPRAQAYHV